MLYRSGRKVQAASVAGRVTKRAKYVLHGVHAQRSPEVNASEHVLDRERGFAMSGLPRHSSLSSPLGDGVTRLSSCNSAWRGR